MLARTAAFYLASPANPQGSVASRAYLSRLAALAQKHNFMLFADECYSEVYWKEPPVGALNSEADRTRRRAKRRVHRSEVCHFSPFGPLNRLRRR